MRDRAVSRYVVVISNVVPATTSDEDLRRVWAQYSYRISELCLLTYSSNEN